MPESFHRLPRSKSLEMSWSISTRRPFRKRFVLRCRRYSAMLRKLLKFIASILGRTRTSFLGPHHARWHGPYPKGRPGLHSNVTAPTWSSSCCLSRPGCRFHSSLGAREFVVILSYAGMMYRGSSPPSCVSPIYPLLPSDYKTHKESPCICHRSRISAGYMSASPSPSWHSSQQPRNFCNFTSVPQSQSPRCVELHSSPPWELCCSMCWSQRNCGQSQR